MGTPIFNHTEVVDESNAGTRLDNFLRIFPFQEFDKSLLPSRTTLQKWIAGDCVRINGSPVTDKSVKLKTGDIVSLEVEIKPAFETPPPEDLDIGIVYRDDDLIVIDKPPGISSHPVPGAMRGSVVNFLMFRKVHLPPTGHPLRPGIVHRLDKNTSGLMAIAKTDSVAGKLIEMIKRREVERTYLAIVFGNPPLNSGTIEKPIGRHEKERKKMAVVAESRGRPARTHYRVLKRYPGFSLVQCRLDTGRTHQIRVHMSHLGYPVAGDPLYGGRRAHDKITKALKNIRKNDPRYGEIEEKLVEVAGIIMSDKIHLLHAAMLKFSHPVTGEEMSFKAEPHEKFSRIFGLLESLPGMET